MKKIIKIVLIGLFMLFLLNSLWTMIQTKEGLDSPFWLQLFYLLVYVVSAIATYREKWYGFAVAFLLGIVVMLVSIIISI
ncbi:hypothetical protein QJV03_06965 [Listeria swaminathanii]|uniref:Uncharacterized protein n=2 Tax=Listeria TaxID=1637 RepID=A0A7X1A1M7_9LIST|nr:MULTISPECIES: hypothetical protein [Listeria]MCD2247614.1 hypothetical protein [Listeria marthii]MBC2329780.1 hypothetical protein [Listeria swaminathanii]MDT0000071.1 hypothetical protein [Listeria cossartiae subsp. cayugensis]MDT0003276.1 hypothetical protein [Listeria cossartiae subsp. cayugensis]MDT0007483.1 hypothetical protein [Listeria cossartiae subsp. cayugensis]